MAQVLLSLVIPAFNEAALLPRLLDSVEQARRRFREGAEAIEVIVADNASTDGTGKTAARRGCVVVKVEKRRIACARNGGASVAQGGILAFVDADSRIHPETFNAIALAMARPDVIAGATGVRLERWSLGIALTYLAFIPGVVLTGMDTGVVFCRRKDFEEIGGYNENRSYGEDVTFLWTLKKRGWKRGQRLVRLTQVKALASMRKFDQFGDWHYFTQMIRLAWLYLRRGEVHDEFANRYWYGDDRR